MPHVARLAVHPVKSLDPERRTEVRILENGALAADREYALVDEAGDYVNGKRTAAVHRLRTAVQFDADDHPTALSVQAEPGTDAPADLREGVTVALPDEADRLTDLLADYFGYEVRLRHDRTGGFPDDTTADGPTVVSTATLERVAEWTGVTVDSVRRRFRANVEVGDTEPFWEDHLYAADGPVRFRVGDLQLLGTGPCNRCVVPLRDPDTGVETPGFRERLSEGRREELPDWAPGERFDHYFKLAVNTRRPADGRRDQRRDGRDRVTVAEGDPVEVLGVADIPGSG